MRNVWSASAASFPKCLTRNTSLVALHGATTGTLHGSTVKGVAGWNHSGGLAVGGGIGQELGLLNDGLRFKPQCLTNVRPVVTHVDTFGLPKQLARSSGPAGQGRRAIIRHGVGPAMAWAASPDWYRPLLADFRRQRRTFCEMFGRPPPPLFPKCLTRNTDLVALHGATTGALHGSFVKLFVGSSSGWSWVA